MPRRGSCSCSLPRLPLSLPRQSWRCCGPARAHEIVSAARANVALAEAKRDGAQAAWVNAVELMENPQELDARIAEARSQVALAEQGVELAEAQLQPVEWNRDLTSEGTVERKAADYQVVAARHALAAAEADLATAETSLNYLWWIRNEPLGYMRPGQRCGGPARCCRDRGGDRSGAARGYAWSARRPRRSPLPRRRCARPRPKPICCA